MIYRDVRIIRERDVANFCWLSLRRFHHVPSLADFLMHTHELPRRHKPDVIKQATQIRQCLIQAREYRDASEVTSLATRPNLIYYSLMSLALAQILLNGTGDQSLDRARDEHKHHGLTFHVGPDLKGDYDILKSAANLRATPMIKSGHRKGTFALWCQQSQEDPTAGEVVELTGAMSQTGPALLLKDVSKGFCEIDDSGVSLLDCLKSIPSLAYETAIDSEVIRATIGRRDTSDTRSLTITTHPHRNRQNVDQLAEKFVFDANVTSKIDVIEGKNIFSFTIERGVNEPTKNYFPPACTWKLREHMFLSPKRKLNEFGYLYLSMYMLGNYARYYPDRWIQDIDQGTPLALLTERLLQSIDERMSLLTLSELSGELHVTVG